MVGAVQPWRATRLQDWRRAGAERLVAMRHFGLGPGSPPFLRIGRQRWNATAARNAGLIRSHLLLMLHVLLVGYEQVLVLGSVLVQPDESRTKCAGYLRRRGQHEGHLQLILYVLNSCRILGNATGHDDGALLSNAPNQSERPCRDRLVNGAEDVRLAVTFCE